MRRTLVRSVRRPFWSLHCRRPFRAGSASATPVAFHARGRERRDHRPRRVPVDRVDGCGIGEGRDLRRSRLPDSGVRRKAAYASAEQDFTVRVDVHGLDPATIDTSTGSGQARPSARRAGSGRRPGLPAGQRAIRLVERLRRVPPALDESVRDARPRPRGRPRLLHLQRRQRLCGQRAGLRLRHRVHSRALQAES